MIQGRFLDGRAARPVPARLSIDADRMLRLEGIPQPRQLSLDEVTVSDRIGSIPRRITFPDGAVFETPYNDAVDAALDAAGLRQYSGWIGQWERHWHGAAAALAAVAVVSWLFVQYGVPAMAAVTARAMPPAADSMIGVEGLELLDGSLFAPSRLPEARRSGLAARFAAMTDGLEDGHDYRLELRRGGKLGPNAFALPSGIVVVTDELVEMAQDDEEVAAVLAHEIGHVRGRHTLRLLLQDAGVAALAFAVLGDVGAASSLAAAVPVVLVQAKHSRDFEREADAYARAWLRERGLPETRFDEMLCRMAQDEPDLSYLSSHPPLRERARCADQGRKHRIGP